MEKSQPVSRAVRAFCVQASICIALGAAVSAQAEDPSSHRDDVPPHRGRKPPPEAFAACEGKAEGAECKVDFRGDVLEGVCIAAHSDDGPFCMPNDMPPPPAGRAPRRNVM